MIEPNAIETRLREALASLVHLSVEDLTGSKDHFQAVIVAGAFEGLTRVEQHQLVYRALGEWMAGPIHALTLQTFTPDQWTARGPSLT